MELLGRQVLLMLLLQLLVELRDLQFVHRLAMLGLQLHKHLFRRLLRREVHVTADQSRLDVGTLSL